MNKYILKLLSIAFIIYAPVCSSYEVGTHARITANAYSQSVLGIDNILLVELGLRELEQAHPGNTFGVAYVDMGPAGVNYRYADPYEKKHMPNGATDALTIKGWIMRGVIREDDWPDSDIPQDDPNPENKILYRPLHHFYDPATNRPLTGRDQELIDWLAEYDSDIHTAPAWAIGAGDPFQHPNVQEDEDRRRNHFTVFDANEAMYRALTGTDTLTGDVIAPTEDERKKYWATVFRSLGDIVHLLQDMAQPQHTRNDDHPGYPAKLAGFHEASVYEKYIDARATGKVSYRIDGSTITPAALTYSGYSAPIFDYYSKFWCTTPGHVPDGKGLADYSNRGFFSAATNIDDPANNYFYPAVDDTYDGQQVDLGVFRPIYYGTDPYDTAQSFFLVGDVVDKYTNTTDQVRLSTKSIWTEHFYGPETTYNLIKENYDDMAGLLIPRAVGYSTGLINYFFRGRLKIGELLETENELEPWNSEVRITVTNVSGVDNVFTIGAFELFYDSTDGTRKKAVIKETIKDPDRGVIASLSNGESRIITAELPVDVDKSKSKPYILVYKGLIGNESGIAAHAVAVKNEDLYIGDFTGGGVYRFNRNGVLVDEMLDPLGNNRWYSLVVFDGVRYGLRLDDDNTYMNETSVFSSHAIPNDVAVNDQYVFVVDILGEHGEYPTLFIYDHQGAEVTSFDALYSGIVGGLVTVAANNEYVAVANDYDTFIYDFNGALITRITNPNWTEHSLAMTKDRVFVMTDGVVHEYGLDGQFYGKPPSPSWPPYQSWCVAVTENTYYVVAHESYGALKNIIHIYDRLVQRDENGIIISENYSLSSVVDIWNFQLTISGCAVDKKMAEIN